MRSAESHTMPRWLFTCLAVAGFWASGLYLGMIRVEGALASFTVRTIAFGLFGLLMLWGSLARR